MNIIQTVTDGDYTMEVLSIDNRVDDKGRKLVEWHLRIIGGTYDQCVLVKRHYLVTDKAKTFLTKEFAKLGLTITNGADCDAQKQQIIGKRIDLHITHNEHGFPNIYIKGMAKGQGPATSQSVEW